MQKHSQIGVLVELISSFYEKVTAKHPDRKELMKKFTAFKPALLVEEAPPIQRVTVDLTPFGRFVARELPEDELQSFYRGVTFSYFERYILQRNEKKLQQIINNVQSGRIGLSEGENQVQFLRQIYQKKFSAMLGDVIADFRSSSSNAAILDNFLKIIVAEQYYFLILIRYIKGLLHNFISEMEPAALRSILNNSEAKAQTLLSHLKNSPQPSLDIIKLTAHAFDSLISIFEKKDIEVTRRDFRPFKRGAEPMHSIYLLKTGKYTFKVLEPEMGALPHSVSVATLDSRASDIEATLPRATVARQLKSLLEQMQKNTVLMGGKKEALKKDIADSIYKKLLNR